MRFRAEQHLRRPREIRAVREQGRRIDCRSFTLWWHTRSETVAPTPAPESPLASAEPATPALTARVCVIASTNAVGNAVRRNRAKRRLRELFRSQQQTVPADCDLLLIARRDAMARPLPELQQMFSDACRRITEERARR